ncbi:MAG TPA: DoxX family protein [Kofleriaceae bacterium]
MVLPAKLERFEPIVFTTFRVLSGLMFMCHGIAKLFGTFGLPHAVPLSSQFGIGAVIELVTGALIALGLFTRGAAFVAAGEMAVAYFQFHVGESGKLLPIQNGGDDAVLYCFWFLLLVVRGPGTWSLDAKRR